MTTQFTNPSGGLSPLGRFSITAGTPVALNSNTGPQSQGALKMTKRFDQLLISTPTANTGDVYLVWGNNAAASNPNNILAVISPGKTVPLPNGLLINSKLNIDNFYFDSTTGTQVAAACVVYG
jgi:hypothetical protein